MISAVVESTLSESESESFTTESESESKSFSTESESESLTSESESRVPMWNQTSTKSKWIIEYAGRDYSTVTAHFAIQQNPNHAKRNYYT